MVNVRVVKNQVCCQIIIIGQGRASSFVASEVAMFYPKTIQKMNLQSLASMPILQNNLALLYFVIDPPLAIVIDLDHETKMRDIY